MKEYSMELCGVKRTLPFIPISEEMAFASFVVLGDTELVSACAPELAAKIGEVDAIVTAEAKGIALLARKRKPMVDYTPYDRETPAVTSRLQLRIRK